MRDQRYPIFSIGDFDQEKLAQFASTQTGMGGQKYYFPNAKKTNPVSTPGVRKSHVRNIGGKAVTVGRSVIKAGKNTAGQLKAAGGKYGGMALDAGKKYGGQGLEAGKKYGGQAVQAGKKYGGQGVDLIKKNPKVAGAAAGAALVGAGIGAVAGSRKKRRRR